MFFEVSRKSWSLGKSTNAARPSHCRAAARGCRNTGPNTTQGSNKSCHWQEAQQFPQQAGSGSQKKNLIKPWQSNQNAILAFPRDESVWVLSCTDGCSLFHQYAKQWSLCLACADIPLPFFQQSRVAFLHTGSSLAPLGEELLEVRSRGSFSLFFFFLLFFWHFIYAHPLSEAELPMSLSKGGTLPTAQLLMVLGIPRHVGQLRGRPMQTGFTHPCNSSALPAMLCCLIQAGCFWLSEICNPTTTHLTN